MTKRKILSKKTRFEIFKRDGFQCQYCGAHPPSVVLVLDHVVPFSDGGKCDEHNLVAACEACNQGKSNRGLSSAPASLSERAEAIAEQDAQLRGYYEVVEQSRARIEDDAWMVADVFIDAFCKDRIRKDWLQSIKHFNQKLGRPEVVDAMEIAVAAKRSEQTCFKYFCGICWNRIKGQS